MNYKIFEHHNEDVNVIHVSNMFTGYGHHKITVEVEYRGDRNTFVTMTNNMPGIDEATSIEDYEEKQIALYNLIDVDDEIWEWLYEFND